jgi:sugar lactone lactonase YvrE
MARSPEVLLDQLYFPEGPRWRTSASGDGKLWFSDMLAGAVMTVDLQGHSETLAEVPQLHSGSAGGPMVGSSSFLLATANSCRLAIVANSPRLPICKP